LVQVPVRVPAQVQVPVVELVQVLLNYLLAS
jgi:hypothetical protein